MISSVYSISLADSRLEILNFSITFEVNNLGVREEWRDNFSSLNPATITMSCI